VTKIIAYLLIIFIPCLSIAGEQGKFRKAYDYGINLIENKEYEKAIELYLWIDENGNETYESYYSIKLPAYYYWGALASRYPKAMQQFKIVRDDKIAKIKLGRYSEKLFTDICFINRSIGESYITVELFEYLDQINPEFAKLSYKNAEDDLIRFKRYRLSRKYLGDPMARLNGSINEYTKLIELDESLKQELDPALKYEVINIITILDKCNERDLSIKIKERALEVLNEKKIKNLLK
jgi:hypothetical protein